MERRRAAPRRRCCSASAPRSRAPGRPAARATFEAAVAAARSIEADDILARAALGFAPFALTPGYVDEAHVALLVEALERIGPARRPAARAAARLAGGRAVLVRQRRRAAPSSRSEALEMARRLGDDATLAFALSLGAAGDVRARTRPSRGCAWLRDAVRADRARRRDGACRSPRAAATSTCCSSSTTSPAPTWRSRRSSASRARRATAAPTAFVPLHRARRAAIEGRFDEAQRLLAEVAAIGGELPASTIPITVASQRVVLTWLQRGPREIGDAVRAYADGVPAMPVWRAALAAALADAGRREEAQLEFDRLAADDFAALPRDNLWLGGDGAARPRPSSALELRRAGAGAARAARAVRRAQRRAADGRRSSGPVEMWLGILARVGGRDARGARAPRARRAPRRRATARA